MTKDITISLTVLEAMAILDPIQDKALTASKLAATSTGDVHEIADLSAKMLGQVATQIVDQLYPMDKIRRRDLEDEIEFGLA